MKKIFVKHEFSDFDIEGVRLDWHFQITFSVKIKKTTLKFFHKEINEIITIRDYWDSTLEKKYPGITLYFRVSLVDFKYNETERWNLMVDAAKEKEKSIKRIY